MTRSNKHKRGRKSKSSNENVKQGGTVLSENGQSRSGISVQPTVPDPAPSTFRSYEEFPPTEREEEMAFQLLNMMVSNELSLFRDGFRKFQELTDAYFAESRANGRKMEFSPEEADEIYESTMREYGLRQPKKD